MLLIEQQRPQAAIGLLQDTLETAGQANEIQPGSIDVVSVKLLLGQVYARSRRFDDAIAIYDSAIQDVETLNQTSSPDFRPTLAKALVLREMGKESEAQPLFEAALAIAPTRFRDSVQQLMQVSDPAEAAEMSPDLDTEAAPSLEALPAPTPEAP